MSPLPCRLMPLRHATAATRKPPHRGRHHREERVVANLLYPPSRRTVKATPVKPPINDR